jgi:hypothetical protein
LGEPNRILRCLTPSVARRCYRESSISRVRPKRARILRSDALGYPPRQDQTPCCLVRATRTFDPGRLQPARAQPCGRANQATFTLTFTLLGGHTLFVRRGQTHRRQDGSCLDGLPCVALRCLAAAPSKAGKMCLASLCNRSTTRAPTDRSIPGRTTFVELTAHRTDTCSERPHGVLPPCGNRTPGGHALDGAFPTSAKPITTLPKREGLSTAPGDATSRRRFQPRARLFDLASDTSCPTPLDSEAEFCGGARAFSVAPTSTRATFETRSAFHRQVFPKEPATALAA